MRVRAGDEGVADSPGFRYLLLYFIYIVGSETDQIECYQCDTGGAVVNNHGTCPQVIVNTCGWPVVLKSCEPYGIELPVAVFIGVCIAISFIIHGITIIIGPGVGHCRGDGHRCKTGIYTSGVASGKISGSLVVRVSVVQSVVQISGGGNSYNSQKCQNTANNSHG